MEGIKFLDDFGFAYEVVSHKPGGYDILFHKDSACQWVIRFPDGMMRRFKTEKDLWQYALENKLFKRKGKKNG